MRRFLLLLMLCLLPLQISWAAAANYCEHAQDKTLQHLGHHDDGHKSSSSTPEDGTQPSQYDLGYDHCHLSSFLGILSTYTFSVCDLVQQSSHCSDCFYSSLAPDKPERPKWSVPA